MESISKFNNSKEIIAFLAERFPACFKAKGEAIPLKIGIFQDIIKRIQDEKQLSKTQLRLALRLYTSSWRYLYSIKSGVSRIDLDGNVCGILEEKHIKYACKQLEEAKIRFQAQRQELQKSKKTKKYFFEMHPCNSIEHKSGEHKIEKKINKENMSSCNLNLNKLSSIVRTLDSESILNNTTLQPGQNIKVKAGKKSINATVLEITKDGIRVQLSSGIAVIMRAEHLKF
ncbi:RNA chaperone ProQ [Pantoea sp. Aalb]|uniref:RNA chaperone ProQ n=1 Tax=Pantoea sp. Aalb TaxID=2576762 RepID=UPI001320C3F4|nr:RNA chaperone ProQ [Pantoea sp. Aalb]MXP67371.1 RNA chaperone ProQ [Pantoea sp. Aalb]